MISYDSEYYKPTTIHEAIQQFQTLEEQGKKPVYFSGGTEIITLGRLNQIVTGAVIDLKGIPEYTECNRKEGQLILGAGLTLTQLRERQLFPFLNKAIIEIADHTARNKITLGGNICANIIYRETVLPLLLTNSRVVTANSEGLRERPINEVFDQTLQLEKGELLVQVITDLENTELPFLCIKKRRQWDVGYPLLTTAAIKKDNHLGIAFSGLCSFPFRNKQLENCLNNLKLSREDRIEQAIQHIPAPVLNDVHGSAEYQEFVLRNTVMDVLNAFEGADQ